MSFKIPIKDLPTDLTQDAAIEAVYGDDLDWIQNKLTQGLSVLVECDKQLTLYLYRAMRARLRNAAGGFRLQLLSGHADGTETANMTVMQRTLRQLQTAVFGGDHNTILVLPHLDVLTTTTQSGLSMETREAAVLLYENPDAVFLAFKDASFELPKVIENLFPVKRSLIGLPRESLPKMITQREARKLAQSEFDAYSLYKYVSGLNAIRLREVLGHFSNRLDFDPAHPEQLEEIYTDIRRMTVEGECELPQVNLDEDIGGYTEVKDKIKSEILSLLTAKEKLTDPEEIKRVEEIVPKGMIFHGPPGTGKTFFAKAMATSLNATIFIVSGPEMKSKWVGESEENLRKVFAQARKAAPSIIVFDELDSFAGARGSYGTSGVEHSMVNQLLTEMDGFRKEELVFVIGTTNFMTSLDSALLRPGRFELGIEIPYPKDEDRKAIVDIYRKSFKLDMTDEMRDYLVERTAGFVDPERGIRFSGDHMYAVMRALKREELREAGLTVGKKDIDKAIGTRKGDKVELTAEEEKIIAAHEGGHAILAYVLPDCPTIEKITIATGEDETLGYVMQAVKKNKYITTENELLDDICVLMGGRVAEDMFFTDVSMGAYNDLQRATEIARMMVEDVGMSPDIGVRTFPQTQQQGAVSSIGATRVNISEETAKSIDDAISHILQTQYERAQTLLQQYEPELQALQTKLLAEKTTGLKALKEIFGGRTFKKDDEDKPETADAESEKHGETATTGAE